VVLNNNNNIKFNDKFKIKIPNIKKNKK
jgi:hypothetical protein